MGDPERRLNNLERRFLDTSELTRDQMKGWARLFSEAQRDSWRQGPGNDEEPTAAGWKFAEDFITECRARGWEIAFASLTKLEHEWCC
jgi:hypothetical protein